VIPFSDHQLRAFRSRSAAHGPANQCRHPGDLGGHRLTCGGNLPLCRNPLQLLKLNLQSGAAGAKLGSHGGRCNGRLWRPADSKDMDLYLRMLQGGGRWIRHVLSSFRCYGWRSGCEGHQTDHRRADAPVGQRARRCRCVPVLSWTVETFFITLQDSGAPHHPLFEQRLLPRSVDWHSAARMLAAIQAKTASAKMAKRGRPFLQGSGRNVASTLPGVMGEGI